MVTLYILTNSCNNVPLILYETESINIDVLTSKFSHVFNVNVMTYDRFISHVSPSDIHGNFFIYASSQYPAYKDYMEDVLLYIYECGGVLVPSFSVFKAHENKVFQALELKRLGISSPGFQILSTIEEAQVAVKNIEYPCVFKTPSGYGSSGVSKISSESKALSYVAKEFTPIVRRQRNIFEVRKKEKAKRGKYPLRVGKVLVQELIEDVGEDWKVLVFGDRLFVLKRFVRENDFRASGSGRFELDPEPDYSMLSFAREALEKLNAPFLSLDIIKKGNKCYLIEYQGVHFGLYTFVKSKYYYTPDANSGWIKNEKKQMTVEDAFHYGYVYYIQRNNLL